MIYQKFSDNEIGYSSKSSNSLAPLDTAFTPSSSMTKFKNKMLYHNPLLSQDLVSEQSNTEKNINDDIQSMLQNIQNPLDEKIDIHVKEIITSENPFSDEEKYINQKNPRSLHYPPIWEGYNGQDILYTAPNQNGMSIYRMILLLILIAALIYGAYWLYQNYKKKSVTVSTRTIKTQSN